MKQSIMACCKGDKDCFISQRQCFISLIYICYHSAADVAEHLKHIFKYTLKIAWNQWDLKYVIHVWMMIKNIHLLCIYRR